MKKVMKNRYITITALSMALLCSIKIYAQNSAHAVVPYYQWSPSVKTLHEEITKLYNNIATPIVKRTQQIIARLEEFKKSPAYSEIGGADCYKIHVEGAEKLLPESKKQAQQIIKQLIELKQKPPKEIQLMLPKLKNLEKLIFPAFEGLDEEQQIKLLLNEFKKFTVPEK